jgi:DNA polymerase elongation subunit (family B)
VKADVRKGLLGRMLSELLDTRVMVKQAMKAAKNDKVCRGWFERGLVRINVSTGSAKDP